MQGFRLEGQIRSHQTGTGKPSTRCVLNGAPSEGLMIVPIDSKRRVPVEAIPSPMPAGMDDTGTGVWIGRIEAAARLGVRESTLDAMARDKMIERVYRRIPGCRPEPLFYLEQIERLLAARPAQLDSLPPQPALAQQTIPIPPQAG